MTPEGRTSMRLSIVVAVAENGVIGRQGTLPWRLSADLQRFKRVTWGHVLIMGRRTYDSIGRPLPGRTSIVLTHRPLTAQPHLWTADSLTTACELAELLVASGTTDSTLRSVSSAAGSAPSVPSENTSPPPSPELFVIGGESVFAEALPRADRLYWTQVEAEVEGDVTFPPVDWNAWAAGEPEHVPADSRNEYATTFRIFTRRAARPT